MRGLREALRQARNGLGIVAATYALSLSVGTSMALRASCAVVRVRVGLGMLLACCLRVLQRRDSPMSRAAFAYNRRGL